jgi:hypothetical protein
MQKKSFSFFTHLIAPCLALGIFLPGCSPNIVHPDYAYFEKNVTINPKPSAIVGIWIQYSEFMDTKIKGTLLLRPDGTGVCRANAINEANQSYNFVDAVTWSYRGDGVWTLSQNSFGTWVASEARLSGDRLLRSGPNLKSVLSRAEQTGSIDDVLLRPSR